MPLLVPPAPAPALRSILNALGSPTALPGARTFGVRPSPPRVPAGPLTTELSLPVHTMDGVGSRRPGAARPVAPRTRLSGWRFQLRGPAGPPAAAAQAGLTPDGWAFSHFVEGPYVTATERAWRQVESLPALFQARLLSIPELYMLTLWLHRDTASDGLTGHPAPEDLLVPLAPAPPGIAAHRPYRVADLLPRLSDRLSPAPLLRTTA
ncbi:hypothetical protein ACFQLX_01275 [Streptomyces polyrhachis]|uniref:Secreted protein n=1 Tax=Streptomyces polyrhachis TaxID=1282885 RepID=A0ABW2GAX5_9ACTN